MENSDSICAGVREWFLKEIEEKDEICVLRGLTVAHKYYSPEHMKTIFKIVVSSKFQCDGKRYSLYFLFLIIFKN